MKSNTTRELVWWNAGRRPTFEKFRHDQVIRALGRGWGWWAYGPFEDGDPERWHGTYSTREMARSARRDLLARGREK